MTTPWSRAQNFIDTVTDGSYKLADEIFKSHYQLLNGGAGNATIAAMLTYFDPFYAAYSNAYVGWLALRGQGTGNTQTLVELIDELSSSRIRKWDVAIQGVYEQGTPQYQSLLPARRSPFQQGGIETRFSAVQALIAAIGTDAALASLKTQIEDFLTTMENARNNQVGGVAGVNIASGAIDLARDNAAQAMFKNYGSCVVLYYQTPEQIANFFPVALLQSKEQNTFTATLRPGNSHRLFKRKLDVANTLTLVNDGDVDIDFFFTDGLITSLQPGLPHVKVAAHTFETIPPSQAGYTDDKRFFFCQNSDPLLDGHCSAQID